MSTASRARDTKEKKQRTVDYKLEKYWLVFRYSCFFLFLGIKEFFSAPTLPMVGEEFVLIIEHVQECFVRVS